jgi:hypothetical protein
VLPPVNGFPHYSEPARHFEAVQFGSEIHGGQPNKKRPFLGRMTLGNFVIGKIGKNQLSVTCNILGTGGCTLFCEGSLETSDSPLQLLFLALKPK